MFRETIIKQLEEGKAPKDIAAAVGCALITVYKTAEKNNVPLPPRGRSYSVEMDGCTAVITDSRGDQILVDAEDAAKLSGWSINVRERGYVEVYRANERMRLHRLLMMVPDGMVIDHINRNPLDNRKQNLRVCTIGENNCNRGVSKNNKAGYKGVSLVTGPRPYRASITKDNVKHHLGSYSTAEEAHAAYMRAAAELFGEFAPE